jgi:hypothetical protein
MRKIVFTSFIFLFSFLFLSNAQAVLNTTLQGISKIYIEYENGQYQVIELPQKVEYSYTLTDSYFSQNGSMSTLLQLGELNQNSKIFRVALWMDNVVFGVNTYSINGFITGSNNGPIGTTSVPVAIWEHGVVTNMNGRQDRTNYSPGVINFNSIGAYSADNNGTLTISDGTAFDASNKSVNLRFSQGYGGYLISNVQTQNL